jgi:hypothetical protein
MEKESRSEMSGFCVETALKMMGVMMGVEYNFSPFITI